MGIPCYFARLIRDHSGVVQKLPDCRTCDWLMFDANSIIYDSARQIAYDGVDERFQNQLCTLVCRALDDYIATVAPKTGVFIAFDGVAPAAKQDQQRQRRFKSMIETDLRTEKVESWSTTRITPGTAFMEELMSHVTSHFDNRNKVIVSTSHSRGEGEHKIFAYLRNNSSFRQLNVYVYGLDADLVMLGLMNVSTVKTLHLLREPPAFNRLALDTEDLMTLSINELENEVLASTGVRRVEDYVIACSLLGNDFLPKFPGLNIRSSGVDALLQSLRVCAKNPRFSLLEGNRVSKKGIQVLVDHLARGEESRVQTDMENKASKRRVGINENETVLNVIPKLATDKERLIDVHSSGWRSRYWKYLMNGNSSLNVERCCGNYLEGLAWVHHYYTGEQVDWSWKYNYAYPPTLTDLGRFVRNRRCIEAPTIKDTLGVSPSEQLKRVVPRPILKTICPGMGGGTVGVDMEWAFCSYFWEGHVIFSEENIDGSPGPAETNTNAETEAVPPPEGRFAAERGGSVEHRQWPKSNRRRSRVRGGNGGMERRLNQVKGTV